jgi:subtilisin family serine protease
VKASGASRFLHLGTRRGILTISTNGNIAGHAAAAGAVAVAAVDVATSFPQPFKGGTTNPVESFESDGPRRVFFQPNGTAITPGDFSATGGVVRQKPDLAAADGGATSVSDRFEKFFGTSAAAPHAAAIAALVKSYNPALTMAQVRAALSAGCRDIEAVGVDADSGAGLLDAVDAIAAAPAPPPPTAKPVIESDAMTLISETNINSKYDPGELVTVSFSLKNTGNAASSQLIATLLPEAGVTEPSAVQDYGALAVNGARTPRGYQSRKAATP